MPMYWGDYLQNTRHLSTAEHGAYLLLIAHYWEHGGLPTDEQRLRRITGLTGKQWCQSRDTLAAFFSEGWKHGRCEDELRKTSNRSLSASTLSEKRWKNNDSSMRAASPTECKSQSQSDLDGGGGQQAPDPVFDLTLEIGKIAGFPDAVAWPLGWSQASQRVRAYLEAGWKPEIMLATARTTMARKRDGPPSTITYFEKPFARAHAEQSAPLPTVEIREAEKVTINGRQGKSVLAAADRLIEDLGGMEAARRYVPGSSGPRPLNLDSGIGPPSPKLVSSR
jgi:uncharacterized protein YdaU (DUF1376 family)